MSGTLALSWGRYGGFYLHRRRVCLGWVALTYTPVEIDAMMRSYADERERLPRLYDNPAVTPEMRSILEGE